MQFRWISKGSDKAAAAMVVARVRFKGMAMERAIAETLQNGLLCHFPDDMPDRERTRFRLLIDEQFTQTDRRSQFEKDSFAESYAQLFQGDSVVAH